MFALFKDLQLWLAANARWLASASRVWLALSVVAIIVLVSFLLPGKNEDSIRYSGLVLQLLGVATVVAVLRDKRRVFDRPSLLSHVKSWIAARPHFRQKPLVIAVTGVASGFAVGSASASSWRGCAANSPMDERVAVLESNVESLRNELSIERKRIGEEATKIATAIGEERSAREGADTAIRARVEAFGAGGLHIEATGLFWLILGIVLATIPAEIALLLPLSK